ncbi:MAG TPA: ATP-binding protein [Edaphobacter sp.]|jgi:two-component system, LuxR family, sensor kinase FixL|nr:ATP-binding protein [Edaphobacter sp.]
MTWMTILWPMVTGACVTMSLINLGIGLRQKPRAPYLLFSLNAFAVAVFSYLELAIMRTDSPAEYLALLRWADFAVAALVLSLTAFVWVFFGTGRRWLALLAAGLTCFAMTADLSPQPRMIYVQLTSIRKMETFGGATYTLAEGVPSPWNAVFYLSLLLLLVFVADASVTLWRRGGRRRAIVVGGTITFFLLAAGGHSALVESRTLRSPYLISFAYLAILLAMGIELSDDVLNAAQLARDLRESEHRMILAAEAANLGIWVRDLTQKEIWATDNWRALFGFSKSEPLSLDDFLHRLHPDERETVLQALARAIEGDGRYQMEHRLVLPDGQMRWIHSRGRVEFNGAGKPILVRGVSLDTTERHKAEQETQLLRQEIAHVSRVSMMGELASSLAHEINQPLGAILRNAEAAELFMQNGSPDLDEIRAILVDIREDDQRAGKVIDRMRGLLKKHDLDTRPLDVRELVGDVAALLRADAAVRQVDLNLDVPSDLPFVRGDRVHLQQVLLNLILNGMDALNGARREDRCVSVAARLDDPRSIEITVSDGGHGIPADKFAHVFEPFFTTKPNGMGMGLPISRTIIEAHGGRLWAENNNVAGAAFRFTLPIVDEEAAAE